MMKVDDLKPADQQDLLDQVLRNIKADMVAEDYTAIEEMLREVSVESLRAFLREGSIPQV